MKKVVQMCWSSSLYRSIFFFLLTLFIVLTYGYYFGTFDQASHIPYLKKTVDSSLFPNDRFFDLRNTHFSYFWLLFIPFYKMGLLEPVMFVVHILSIYLTFFALWKLCKTLFNNALTSFLALIASAFPHIGFSGFPLFEFSMLNRTVTLPFELIALNFYLQKKYVATFILLGVLYNFHALSVHFVLAMIGMDMIITLIQKRNYQAFLSTPLFLVFASPVFIWKFGHSGVPLAIHWDWFNLLNMSTFFHLFNFISVSKPVVTLLTAGGVSALILFFIAKRNITQTNNHQVVAHFMYGGIVVLFIQVFATLFFPITIIIQGQIIRIGTFLTLFAYLYMAHMISANSKTRERFVCFVTSLFLSFSPFFLLLSLIFWRIKNSNILKIITTSFLLIFLSVLYLFFLFNLARPGIHIWPEKTPFYEAQVWAKNNTPKNALFITPPAKWWLYDVEWRVVSERSTISTLSELLEAAFDPNYIQYWKPRFEDLAPNVLKRFNGDYLKNLQMTTEAYYSNNKEQFIYLGKKYHALYLVCDASHRYDLPILYKNSGYTIYSLKYPVQK